MATPSFSPLMCSPLWLSNTVRAICPLSDHTERSEASSRRINLAVWGNAKETWIEGEPIHLVRAEWSWMTRKRRRGVGGGGVVVVMVMASAVRREVGEWNVRLNCWFEESDRGRREREEFINAWDLKINSWHVTYVSTWTQSGITSTSIHFSSSTLKTGSVVRDATSASSSQGQSECRGNSLI